LAKQQAENEAKAAAKKAEEEAANAAQEAQNNKRLNQQVNALNAEITALEEKQKELSETKDAEITILKKQLSEAEILSAEKAEGKRLVQEVLDAREALYAWCKEECRYDKKSTNWEAYTDAKKIIAQEPIIVPDVNIYLENKRKELETHYKSQAKHLRHMEGKGDCGWRSDYTDDQRSEQQSEVDAAYAEMKEWKGRNGEKIAKYQIQIVIDMKESQERDQATSHKIIDTAKFYEERLANAEEAVCRNINAREYAIANKVKVNGIDPDAPKASIPTEDPSKKKKVRGNEGQSR